MSPFIYPFRTLTFRARQQANTFYSPPGSQYAGVQHATMRIYSPEDEVSSHRVPRAPRDVDVPNKEEKEHRV